MSIRGRGWGPAIAATLLAATAAQPATAQGTEPIWTYESDGSWTAETISVGNRGTQVFAEHGAFSNRVPLFSTSDSAPVAPVWESDMQAANFYRTVDSAEETDLHAAMHQVYVSGTTGLRKAVLRVFCSATDAPVWSYDFPVQIADHPYSKVAVAEDGGRVVGAVYDFSTGTTHVASFAPGSSTPVGYAQVSTFGPFLHMALSDDGSTLMLASTSKLSVVELPSGAVLFSKYLIGEPNYGALDLSGDGERFAFGTSGKATVYERQGAAYQVMHTHVLPAGAHCNRLALSPDGQTLALGLNYGSLNSSARVQGLDLSSGVLFLNHAVNGSGTLTNAVSAVAVSDDGERIAAGLWGDSAGLAPELFAFRRGNATPVLAVHLPGSVLDLDLSADGRTIAVAQKGAHASEWGGGGAYRLYEVGTPDLQLEGVPHAGATVLFEMDSRPGDVVRLLSSPNLADVPMPFPNVGTLYLDRDTLSYSPPQTAGPDGTAHFVWQVPSSPSMIGTTRYFQGVVIYPRELTEDMVTLTVLP